jgi:RNA polymerase sigma factor (sigma-70 family)
MSKQAALKLRVVERMTSEQPGDVGSLPNESRPVAPDQDALRAEDRYLLRRFVSHGDRAALGKLFARHADAGYRLARRYFPNGADAEDAVQTGFLNVLRLASQFRGETTVRSWIMGSIVSACRHKLREEARRAVRERKASAPESRAVPDPVVSQEIVSAVQQLPEHYRVPVWMHYYEGMTSPEIASALEMSENTVRTQVSRGIDRLRAALATSGFCLTGPALLSALGSVPAEAAPGTLTAALAHLAQHATGAVAAAGTSGSAAVHGAAAAGKAALGAKVGLGVVAATLVTVGTMYVASKPKPPDLPPPVALWKFDEGSGTVAVDSSGNGNNGTLHGGVTWAANGKHGGALRFDGTGYVDVGRPASLNFTGTITVAAWIQPTNVGTDNVIVGKGFTGAITPFWLSLMGSNRARFGHFDNGYHMADGTLSSGSFTDGAWHHVAGVYDGTAYRLYVDGREIASQPDRVAISAGANSIEIGRINENGGIKHFVGLMDDVCIYRAPLDARQIATLAGLE